MKALCGGLMLLATLAATAAPSDQEALNDLYLEWAERPPASEKVTPAYVRARIRYWKMEQSRTDARRARLAREGRERLTPAAPGPACDERAAIDRHDIALAVEALPREEHRQLLAAHAAGCSAPEISQRLEEAGTPMSAESIRQALSRDIPRILARQALDRERPARRPEPAPERGLPS